MSFAVAGFDLPFDAVLGTGPDLFNKTTEAASQKVGMIIAQWRRNALKLEINVTAVFKNGLFEGEPTTEYNEGSFTSTATYEFTPITHFPTVEEYLPIGVESVGNWNNLIDISLDHTFNLDGSHALGGTGGTINNFTLQTIFRLGFSYIRLTEAGTELVIPMECEATWRAEDASTGGVRYSASCQTRCPSGDGVPPSVTFPVGAFAMEGGTVLPSWTGVGTLLYSAPESVAADAEDGYVWISSIAILVKLNDLATLPAA